MDQNFIVEYHDTYYKMARKELIKMFKMEKRFRDEDAFDNDVIINLINTNQNWTSNLDDLEISVKSS